MDHAIDNYLHTLEMEMMAQELDSQDHELELASEYVDDLNDSIEDLHQRIYGLISKNVEREQEIRRLRAICNDLKLAALEAGVTFEQLAEIGNRHNGGF